MPIMLFFLPMYALPQTYLNKSKDVEVFFFLLFFHLCSLPVMPVIDLYVLRGQQSHDGRSIRIRQHLAIQLCLQLLLIQ